jgi:cation transport regulator ChaC
MFAYGSNLSLEGVATRCTDAEFVDTAVLHDWRLTFRGCADIEPHQGSKCHGVVWRCSREDMWQLDRYEGYPNFYGSEWVDVELSSGEIARALVYVMKPSLEDRASLPSEYYLQTIVDGYAAFGLPYSALRAALERTLKRVQNKQILHFHPEGRKRLRPGKTPTKRKQRRRPAELIAPDGLVIEDLDHRDGRWTCVLHLDGDAYAAEEQGTTWIIQDEEGWREVKDAVREQIRREIDNRED